MEKQIEKDTKNRDKYDVRIKKTDQALVNALFSLLSEKNFDDITVQSICDLASIRRATFYTHFNDKNELFAYAIKCTYRSFPTFSSLLSQERTKDLYLVLIEDIVNFISTNIELINSFRKSNLTYLMFHIISSEICVEICDINSTYTNNNLIGKNNADLSINFYVKGVFSAIQWWIENDYPISKEELISQIDVLLNIGNN